MRWNDQGFLSVALFPIQEMALSLKSSECKGFNALGVGLDQAFKRDGDGCITASHSRIQD